METFSERFKALKESKGLTYPQIAAALGIKQRQATAYAMGESFPDYHRLLLLANLFSVSLDYLTGRTDIPEVNRNH